MKPMLPTLAFDIPKGEEWRYEIKFDGFRALLKWDKEIELISRNGKPLLPIFPEISEFLNANRDIFEPYLPFILDAELVYLENSYKSNFGAIQVRGRMRSQERIQAEAKKNPCRLLVFDLLELKGKSTASETYQKRRNRLHSLFSDLGLPLTPDNQKPEVIQLVPSETNLDALWEMIVLHDGEGIVAKQLNSKWEEGKRAETWIKSKNWKYVSCFVTAYEKSNGYFYISVYREGEIHQIGLVIFGFKPDEKNALHQIIKQNNSSEDQQFIYVEPGICLDVKYLEIYEEQLREPHFHQFRFDLSPDDCSYEKFVFQQKNLPPGIEITHPDKPLWEKPPIQKMDYIHYLREVSPLMLPFLNNRLLTVIRYPHGMFGEAFYQKNVPDYAPDFVATSKSEGIEYIVCDNMKTLLWLGNQIAIEFHIPFQTIGTSGPDEIVFDLDPPFREYFHLAIKAAVYIKEVLDELKLISFIKTSGNKGLQIYIPLPANTFSYEDTRLFTSFIANYLVSKDPDSFTIERLKKHRGNRLYVDYIQHAEGKTIVCPYSARGKSHAGVATPLFWEEVNEDLNIEEFQLGTIIQRVKKLGCPFREYFKVKEVQNFEPVLQVLKAKK
ncbi:DNA ligase D [Mesobacillus subterraneus]|uniref:DNA ligase (ATP) n=1 Tax=Mesobacillus subterraneus TaxID=285983 RepID=A0A3R9DSB2_9BACI|nr:DNA ligase D [Mesobacillus subterraneus]RSD26220.1 DNA ligase D [Mesobacillus subterraneus]